MRLGADAPVRVLAGVLLFVTLLAGAASGVSGTLSISGFNALGTESARADDLVRSRFGGADPGLVLRAEAKGAVDGPRARAAGVALARRVAEDPAVVSVESYWTSRSPVLRSHDGRSALLSVRLAGDESAQARAAQRLVGRVGGAQGALRVDAGGRVWTGVQAAEQGQRDLARAELVTAPLTLIVLAVALRSLLLALLPVLVGAVAVGGTWAVLQLLNQWMEVSAYALNITVALGFALAVDYALLVVARFGEERSRGHGVYEAAAGAAYRAGRSVLVSAGMVMLSFAGLWVFPFPWLRSMAVAGIAVVALASLASVLLLPALLVLGAAWLRPRRLAASVRWRCWARRVTARPWVYALGGSALLAVLVWPFGQARWAFADERALPEHAAVRVFTQDLRRDFPAQPDRDVTVVVAPAPAAGAVDRYARRLSALPGAVQVQAPAAVYRSGAMAGRAAGIAAAGRPAGDAVLLRLLIRADPQSATAVGLVQRVRELPAPGRVWVGGSAARHTDARQALADRVPLALGLVALSVVLVLGLYMRSVLIPFKALVMGALSLTASLGSMVYIFQQGHMRWLVGDFTATGRLDMTLPPLLCAIAFALCLDYEVFLLARIREYYTATGDHTGAVVEGLAHTGRLISTAAAVFALSMAGLASSSIVALKLVGVGLALAVIVDATAVRAVLVPAVMQLTGHANWWAPTWMKPRHGSLKPTLRRSRMRRRR